MKKLLILMLVLAMTSMASAVLQISVNGDMDPTDSEYTVAASDNLTLDIWTTTAISVGVGETYYALAAKVADGTISGGIIAPPYDTDVTLSPTIYNDAAGGGYVPLPSGDNGVYGQVFSTGGTYTANSVIFDQIIFHCESAIDVTVYLIEVTSAWTLGATYDDVLIHQPEPMTIALLGLGGLFLRRRK